MKSPLYLTIICLHRHNKYRCIVFDKFMTYRFIIRHWVIIGMDIKVEYHANENPLKNSEKNSIC